MALAAFPSTVPLLHQHTNYSLPAGNWFGTVLWHMFIYKHVQCIPNSIVKRPAKSNQFAVDNAALFPLWFSHRLCAEGCQCGTGATLVGWPLWRTPILLSNILFLYKQTLICRDWTVRMTASEYFLLDIGTTSFSSVSFLSKLISFFYYSISLALVLFFFHCNFSYWAIL